VQDTVGHDAQGQNQGQAQEQGGAREISLTVPGVEEVIDDELSLPLLLVRKEDGVGFGTGTKLVFPKFVDGADWVPQVKRQ
jgi:hypothetical protein